MAYVERQRGGRHRIPMRDREQASGWTAVCELDDIEPGRGVVCHVNGAELAIMRDGDDVFAMGNHCPHRGGQTTAKIVDFARICGRQRVSDLNRSDLASLDPELVPTHLSGT